ncbi:metallophosphoesterase [Streptomyces sp. SID13666]|uniref:metallophosphoesterase family protein n=1 Tax=unclassified Streptomyces TaxID=2593676 RepID=UPI0013C29A38|nr:MULTISPECIES: metallophosphoesterase [unclassified Streptomyces]NEA56351.1 metallophosphoesterase [Streptomyces sp. SID13666]NEA73711.1 metallophosphoesterase [Streptomyces sp. SID13588]
MPDGKLWGISDLHVAFAENRKIVEGLRPESDTDWLIVAGDVGELTDGIEWALTLLSSRYARVVWAPGNHDLWTPAEDPVQLRGEARYRHLVEMCRSLGVLTSEDPYPVWEGAGGPAVVAPLFVLYDYTFRTDTAANKEESLAQAYKSGIVCSDEFLLHPDPYPSRDAWCRARLKESERRLRDCDPALPLVLVNHFPLVRQPTRILHYPEFAQWCGTERTADWHRRFTVSAVVYGHLHIPRTAWYDGVRFEEVSVGYPREWNRPGHPRTVPRQILPEPAR